MTLNARRFDKGGDNFYDQISALHKSVRGSGAGRRAVLVLPDDRRRRGSEVSRAADRADGVEDIGLADPRALQVANDAAETYERLGSPEGGSRSGRR